MHDRQYNTESILSLARIPTENEQDRFVLQQAANTWLSQLEQTKWPRALQYFENASYLQGNHLTRFYYTAEIGFGSHAFGVNDQSHFDNLVAKSADNRLLRPTETVVSMLSQTKPHPRVEANSSLPEDEDAAALSEIVLDVLWEKPLNMPGKIREVAMLGCIAGTVAVEIEYGETDLPVVVPEYRTVKRKIPKELREEGEPEEEEVLELSGETVEMRRDIMARVWSAFHLTPDPAATSPEDMKWIARSSFEDVEWIIENYARDTEGYVYSKPEDLREHISCDNATKHVLYWWSKLQDIIESPQYYQHGGGLVPQSFSIHGGAAPGQTLLTVIDVKPSREFPKGRTLIIAGGALIYAGPARAFVPHPEDPNRWRYPWRWHPYAFWGWLKVPGKFFHIPLLSELVPLQKKINAIDVLVQANRQFMVIGQWLLPKHSKVPEGMLSGYPGEHVPYTDIPGMSKPERVPHVPLPAELLAERDTLFQAIDYLAASGVTDFAVSKSAARAGVILDFLRQEKLRSKSPMLQEFEQFLETIAQNILIEIQANLDEDDPELTQRIQMAAREHSSLAIEAFTGQSLRDHHSVKIDIASELLKSPEAKQAKALEAAQYLGATMSPLEKRAVFKAIELDQFIQNEQNASVERARRMLSRVIAGQLEAAFPMVGVDHARAMLPVFQTEILSDRFHDHPPEIKEAIYALFETYSQLAQEEAQREFQLQLASAQAMAAAQKAGTAEPEAPAKK